MAAVRSLLASQRSLLFSKTYCPFCVASKGLLTELGAPFETIELDKRADGAELQAELLELTGQSTVPNYFLDGESLGGNSDLVALHKDGALEARLKEAGLI
eukprot:PLAT1572.1.p3 GENE.PLAT1572.1~~PLAT1572.1.p3  ORF type:complete len:113 (+),score=38.82 PLAT1572.1:37-339(+)